MDAPDLRIAGLGRRAVAALLDLALVTVVVAAWLTLLEQSLGARTSWVLVAALCTYGFLLEGAFAGRTIGKALLGLRVVDADGAPPGIGAAFARNVLRAADLMPVLPPYAVGGGLALAGGPSRRRVGDLVAGTRVVRH